VNDTVQLLYIDIKLLVEELHVMSFPISCDSSLLWLLVVRVLQWYKTDINSLLQMIENLTLYQIMKYGLFL